MKIQTMSIVCGTTACNAKCPFCVSSLTPSANLPTDINYRNLKIACRLAERAQATTCLITGKGEPTLYPELIKYYLYCVKDYFPFIELQTNGIALVNDIGVQKLTEWYEYGLTTICLSAVHYKQERNKEIYGDKYPELDPLIEKLHDVGLTVRLSVMLLKNYIDSPDKVAALISFCKTNRVEQLTIRPIDSPNESNLPNDKARQVAEWIWERSLRKELDEIRFDIEEKATPVLHLAHGATVYDYDGQNICLTDCLTTNDTDDNIRQIIYFPDGTILYDWCYRGARLL